MVTDSLILLNRKRVFEFAAERRLVDRVRGGASSVPITVQYRWAGDQMSACPVWQWI
jgi:hypothetical protein